MKNKNSPKQNIMIAYQQPVDVLIQFMNEMNQWEKQCWIDYKKALSNNDDIILKQKRDLARMNEIFAKYCTTKKRVKNLVGVFSFPPEYDPDNETILETVFESSSRVVIYTQHNVGFRLHFKYVLLHKGKHWLIDNKQSRVNNNQKWKRRIL
jgi:hypothetical protein